MFALILRTSGKAKVVGAQRREIGSVLFRHGVPPGVGRVSLQLAGMSTMPRCPIDFLVVACPAHPQTSTIRDMMLIGEQPDQGAF